MWKLGNNLSIERQVTGMLRQHLLLPLAVILLTGQHLSSARAECGHYVVRQSKAIGEEILSTAMVAPEAAHHHEKQPPMRPSSPYAPCHGPHCSNNSSTPLVPPTTVAPHVEHWGDLLAPSFVLDTEPTWRMIAESLQLPRIFVQTIYHPPRSSPTLGFSVS